MTNALDSQIATKNPIDKKSVYTGVGLISGAAVLFSCLTPVIIGAFAGEFSFTESQLGYLFSAYNFGFTIIAIAAIFFVRRVNWKVAAFLASILGIVALVSMTMTRDYTMFLWIIAALGLGKGALYSIGMAIMGDSDNPDKAFGIKLGLENIPSAILLFLIPAVILPASGFKGAFYALAAVLAVLGLASFLLPAQSVKADANLLSSQNGEVPELSLGLRIAALIASIVFFTGIIATWAFLELIANVKSFEPEAMGMVLMVGFILSSVGAFLAAIVGDQFGRMAPQLTISVVALLGLILILKSGVFLTFALGVFTLLFTVNFGLAYLFGLNADIDLSGKLVVLCTTSLSIGGVIGPAIAGLLMENHGYQHVLGFSALCIILALVLYLIVVRQFAEFHRPIAS